ncbi:ABC transporter substrate-binding protein [Amycolatopsis thermophila]|uniref:Sulfonate transport system substrate-binding protein n=1 Tax=Amycolatopsis thermophila TaxID=206084 RepID=A0ABU0F3M4_9PSEU|nr:ABC transporter substrate-binding protein [Amycolatopsis thermophila]MDQ0382093.1 sulfonate transport system substrate-binding protein [Amycolatopsis thermophila]
MRLPRVLTVVAALALSLTACGGGTESPGPSVPPPVSAADLAKVTLKVGDQKGGSHALLKAAGLLGDLPYRIEWSTFTSGPPLLEAASAGAIDVGGVGNTPPIFSAAAKAKISIVSSAQGDVRGDALLVPADSAARSITDLKGKTIGVAKGSSAHGQVLLNLRKAGLSTKDVKLSFLQPADAYGAFTRHQIDAWAVWDPYTAQAKLEAGARTLVDGTGIANGYTFQVAGNAALSDAGKNAAIRDYVVRIAKAQHWADAHRDDWGRAWAADTGLAPEVALAAARNGPDVPVALDATVIASEQELADAFTDDGVLPGKVDFAEFTDTRFAADLAAVRG